MTPEPSEVALEAPRRRDLLKPRPAPSVATHHSSSPRPRLHLHEALSTPKSRPAARKSRVLSPTAPMIPSEALGGP